MNGIDCFFDSKYPKVRNGYHYADQIRKGEIDVCVHVKNCVDRFFSDIEKSKQDDCEFYFDPEKAERFLRLVQRFKHVKGANWKSPYIIFEPWQCFIFMYLMGFMLKATKRRRFRTAYVEVPRGNGKSAIVSQTGLYFLSLDKELGPEVVCAATKKDQARIVFDDARKMALSNKSFTLKTSTKVLAHTIIHEPSGGIMKPIASDSKSLDGLNPSLIIGDETHEWRQELYGVLDSATAKRDDSLFFMISTAGLSTETIGHENHVYTKRVLAGEVEDDTWFGIIYTLDEGDDPYDENNWSKANPNWGVSVDPRNFEAKAKKSKETPVSKVNFLVKHLNQWQDAGDPFFNKEKYKQCKREIKLEDFYGQNCYMALDLASKIDLTAKSYVFKDTEAGKPFYYFFDKAWIPEARLRDSRNAKYEKWRDQGILTVFPGEVNDFEKIQESIYIDDNNNFRINAVHCDPWSANETIQRLQKEFIDVYEFRMTTGNLSEPMKKLDALIRELRMAHDGNELAQWNMFNVVARIDANENVFPRKEHARFKIDIAVSRIMAIAGFINDELNQSVYENQDIRVW